MKQINVYFEEEEHKMLIDKKGKMSWRKFILWMLEAYNEGSVRKHFNEMKGGQTKNENI